MRPDGSLDPKDAAIGIVVAAIVADGLRFRAEVDEGAARLRELAPHLGITWTDVARRLEYLGGVIARDGVSPFVDRCLAALPREMHGPALAAARAVVAADGRVAAEESAFLRLLSVRVRSE